MSILPIISMSDLQRSAKQKLEEIKDFAVIRRHGKDMAFVLHPALGKVLLESGMLELLKQKMTENRGSTPDAPVPEAAAASSSSADNALPELDRILGQVLRELSKR